MPPNREIRPFWATPPITTPTASHVSDLSLPETPTTSSPVMTPTNHSFRSMEQLLWEVEEVFTLNGLRREPGAQALKKQSPPTVFTNGAHSMTVTFLCCGTYLIIYAEGRTIKLWQGDEYEKVKIRVASILIHPVIFNLREPSFQGLPVEVYAKISLFLNLRSNSRLEIATRSYQVPEEAYGEMLNEIHGYSRLSDIRLMQGNKDEICGDHTTLYTNRDRVRHRVATARRARRREIQQYQQRARSDAWEPPFIWDTDGPWEPNFRPNPFHRDFGRFLPGHTREQIEEERIRRQEGMRNHEEWAHAALLRHQELNLFFINQAGLMNRANRDEPPEPEEPFDPEPPMPEPELMPWPAHGYPPEPMDRPWGNGPYYPLWEQQGFFNQLQ